MHAETVASAPPRFLSPVLRVRLRRSTAWAGAGAAYAALTAWATWPLLGGIGHHVVDPVATHGPIGWLTLADVLLVIWALAWDVHALLTAPLALFDANV